MINCELLQSANSFILVARAAKYGAMLSVRPHIFESHQKDKPEDHVRTTGQGVIFNFTHQRVRANKVVVSS